MHDVGTVVVVVEVHDPLAQAGLPFGPLGQGLLAAHRETHGGVGRIEQGVEDLVLAACVIAQARLIFGVHHVALAAQAVGVEQRVDEEPTEAIQSAFEGLGLHIEEVVGVQRGGEGVVAPAVAADVALVGVGLGVGLGAQKQHMFEQVGEPLQVIGILGAAHRYIE